MAEVARSDLPRRIGRTMLTGLYTHFLRPPAVQAKAVHRKPFRCDLGSPFMNDIHVIHPAGQPTALESASCTFLRWILSFDEEKESGSPTAKVLK